MTRVVETLELPGHVTPSTVSWNLFVAGENGRQIVAYAPDGTVVHSLSGRLYNGMLRIESVHPNDEITPSNTVYGLTVEVQGRSIGTRYLNVPDQEEVEVVDCLTDPPATMMSSALAIEKGERVAADADLQTQIDGLESGGVSEAELEDALAEAVVDRDAAIASAVAGRQPINPANLTPIAALTSTAFGRALLELANAAALRTAAGLGTIATAASGDYLPISGGILTGELVLPDLKVTGIGAGGFTNSGRLLGTRTSAGFPLSGTFLAGDWGYDSLGRQIGCIESGTPGKWVYAGGTVIQSGITTATQTAITTVTDIVGSTVTFTAPAQSVMLELSVAGISNDNTPSPGGWIASITDSSNAALAVIRRPLVSVANSGEAGNCRILMSGLTYGTPYTYKGRIARVTSGSVTIAAATAPVFASQLLVIAA